MSTEQHRCEAGTPTARREFAQRLRELRVPRGFRTARSLARALDIDENRYTRYERAEVEPDLTMIRRICETLGVTPDALLRPANAGEETDPAPAASPTPIAGPNGSEPTTQPARSDLQTAAWLLAEATMELLRLPSATRSSDSTTPLASVTETCKLYKALMERPFETISELLMHSDVTKVDHRTASMLRDFIDQFVAAIKARG